MMMNGCCYVFFEIVISQLGEESNLDGHVNEGDKELVVSFCSKAFCIS
jgi:hypothetical protein